MSPLAVSGQTANLGDAGDAARSVAVADVAGGCPDQAAGILAAAGHADRSVAVAQGAAAPPVEVEVSDQAADIPAAAGYAAGSVTAADFAVALPGQGANKAVAGYFNGRQPHVADAAGESSSEQAYVPGLGPVDVQVGDGVVVAVKIGVVPGAGSLAPDGNPAGAPVPVGVAFVNAAVVVGVEVQAGVQLVAVTAGGGAAHAGGRAGEGGGVGRAVRDAVAVQVVADGVQLRQGSD